MSNFVGLCIGGPIDGQHYTNLEGYFRHPIPPTVGNVPTTTSHVEPKAVETFVYMHFIMSAYGFEDGQPADYKFWVDASIPESARSSHVMAALMQSYRRL